MLNLTRWLAARISGTVENIWCVSCKARRSVIRQKVTKEQNSKASYNRLVGKCMVCDGITSTFVRT